MPAMIAKMSGEETGGAPRRHIVRRLLTSIGTAVLVVLIASRFNRSTKFHSLIDPPGRADEILSEVRLKTQTVSDAIEAINRATKERLRTDTSATAELSPRDNLPGPLPLRNVRLGTAVALALRPWAAWRKQHPAWILNDVESLEAPVEGRLYDVQDILADVERWEGVRSRTAYAKPSTYQQGGFMFGAVSLSDQGASGVASLIQSVVLDGRVQVPNLPSSEARGWGRWVYVRATTYEHRNIELFLMLVRRGLQPAAQIGAQR